MKKNVLIFAVLLIVSALFSITAVGSEAATEGHHVETGIPFGSIGIQALNLGILLVVLVYFAKQKVLDAFAAKRTTYLEQYQKTEKALREAEAKLKDAREKLRQLESTESDSITAATTEAESTKNKMVREAELQAQKLKTDVEMVVSAETYKVRSEIRNQIIEKSIASAEQSIKTSSAAITQKSESGFLQDLGQVKA
jgi:F-type H+-transporting ATPase subunit b